MVNTRKGFRKAAVLTLFILIGTAGFNGTVSAEDSRALQKMIDSAPAGASLMIPAGSYSGPVTINRPLKIAAQGEVTLRSSGAEPVLTMLTDRASVSGLRIIDERDNPQKAAVIVTGTGNTLENLFIQTNGTGIHLEKAFQGAVRKTVIEGTPTDNPESRKGNGIDLLESHENIMENNQIRHMFDGVYMESSNSNQARDNLVEYSRYGYHLMYTKNAVIAENRGYRNVTGAMVMGSENVKVKNNNFSKQSENVNAQGVLLFDVKNSELTNNIIEGNRVGIYAETAGSNVISGNSLSRNFIGLEMIASTKNELTGNNFLTNVVQAEAQSSKDNKVYGNYWDDLQGIDLDGKGISAVSYQVNPFFQTFVDQVPAFQLFFQSPGMAFLENLFSGDTGEWMKDEKPLMKPAEILGVPEQAKGKPSTWLSLLLLVGTITLIYRTGVKRI